MKLILANNQTSQFVDFYDDLKARSDGGLDYSGYKSLLFSFYAGDVPISVYDVSTGKQLTDYDGVYINSYLNSYELAAATALSCEALHVPFVNKELSQAPSLSKLTSYVKLAATGVPIPRTLAGAKQALLRAPDNLTTALFPAVLKRADADRGIDNFKVADLAEAHEILADYKDSSIWILQTYVENDGFYVVSFYNAEPSFCIFRSLQPLPDGNARKAHMYKPKGGANAELIALDQVPTTLISTAQAGMTAMNRQIGSVDCLYDSVTDKVHVLEVNYNPQLVTIETFKETRIQAFLDNLSNKW